jgi:ATP synthase protein I
MIDETGLRPYNPPDLEVGGVLKRRPFKESTKPLAVCTGCDKRLFCCPQDRLTMTVPSDPQTRRLAVRILLWQVAATIVLGALVALWAGPKSGVSAVTGGLIGLIANLYMTVAVLRPARSAGFAFGRLLAGQFVKVLLTVGMFLAVAQREDVVWPAVLAGYVATLGVFWVVPALAAPRLPPRSRARE